MTLLSISTNKITSLNALPVVLGQVEIGLESYDGYQEGLAYLSTDENGETLEILIEYRGFGLDTVTWTFSQEDFLLVRRAAELSALWRSRLLELDVNQTVLRNVNDVTPELIYSYRDTQYPVDPAESTLSFLRQGKEYGLLLTEITPGADTRRSGNKILPVFTLHFPGRDLPVLRDLISEEGVSTVLAEYSLQKTEINQILDTEL